MLKMPGETIRTSSGIPVELVYDAESVKGFDLAAQLGEPGQYPFTRGIQPTMYRGRLWTIGQCGGRGGCQRDEVDWVLRSIFRRRLGMTRIHRWRWVRWGRLEWRSIRLRIC